MTLLYGPANNSSLVHIVNRGENSGNDAYKIKHSDQEMPTRYEHGLQHTEQYNELKMTHAKYMNE